MGPPAGGAVAEGNRTACPHDGHAYSLTPRCRSGVRHFGHGIGFALTHAANISWERRSPSARDASPAAPEAVGGEGGGERGDAGGVAGGADPTDGVPVRAEESRPHCGQTARLPDPVAWSGT